MLPILVCAMQSIHDIQYSSSSSADVVGNHDEGVHAAACLPAEVPAWWHTNSGNDRLAVPSWFARWCAELQELTHMDVEMAGDELSLSGLAARKEGVASPVRPRQTTTPTAAVASSPEGAWAPISSATCGQSALILLVHGGWDQNDTAKQVKGSHGDSLGL